MSGARSRLLVVGNIPVDRVYEVAQLPTSGHGVIASRTALAPGGSLNVIVAARLAGLAVRFGGAHGRGPLGDLVRARLAAAGCDVVQDVLPDRDSSAVVALVEPSGQRSFVSPPDVEIVLDESMTARLDTVPADSVYLSGYSLHVGRRAAALVDWVAALPADRLLCCDLGPVGLRADPDVLARLFERVDWLSCSIDDLGLDPSETLESAAALLARRTRHASIVLRGGDQGCVVLGNGLATPTRVRAYPVDPVDTNGAGDTHCGWFLAGLAHGLEPVDAAWRANVAAARSVTRRGPATSPTLEEVEEALAGAAP